jgi:hypothetical protein
MVFADSIPVRALIYKIQSDFTPWQLEIFGTEVSAKTFGKRYICGRESGGQV